MAVKWLLVVSACLAQAGGQQLLLAPLDADQECLEARNSTRGTAQDTVLLDSRHYRSLGALWFPDDEALDLFAFPVPEDPVRWELVDQSECRNVWQYCGNTPSDILITQSITAALNRSNHEVVISVEYAFFHSELDTDVEPCTTEDNGIIVEVDDTTGLSNVHTELISQCTNGTRHDFIYTPRNSFFEMVFRSNLTEEGVCVNISHVLVYHCGRDRVAVDDPEVSCLECPSGYFLVAEQDECLPCPAHSSSSSARSSQCVCEVGYERSLPGNYSLPCNECAGGYFMHDNGLCLACPLPGSDGEGRDSDGRLPSVCRCFNETTVADNVTCSFCADNYLRNSSSGECVLCPAGSRREVLLGAQGLPVLEAEESCACLEGSLTRSGSNLTVMEPCDDCQDPMLYWDSTQCVSCPAHSQRSVTDSTRCECEPESVTLAGQNLTTMDPCVCVAGLYRVPGTGLCQSCPTDSHRVLGDPEQVCGCLGRRRRENDIASLPCLPYVGFNLSSLELQEGEDGTQTHSITIALSLSGSTGSPPVSVEVVVLASGRDLNAEVRPNNITFLAGVGSLDVVLTYFGNSVALEEDTTLNLSLAVSGAEGLLIGGPGLHGNLAIAVRDDDPLHVGFTEDVLLFGPSEREGSIRVNISAAIGRNLVILVRTNDTLSDDPSPQTYELTFTPGEEATTSSQVLDFDLRGDRRNMRYVELRVEVATYPESQNMVRERITVGGLEGLHHQAVVVLEGGGTVLSQSAVIGITCSVLVVVFNVVMVAAVLCFCYRKHVFSVKNKTPQAPVGDTEPNDLEMEKLREELTEERS